MELGRTCHPFPRRKTSRRRREYALPRWVMAAVVNIANREMDGGGEGRRGCGDNAESF